MEIFRCPTCIGVLADAHVPRCPHCRQRLRRKRPRVLGEHARIGAASLPIDRWMLERLRNDGRRGNPLPPVPWHGRFTTSPLAQPAFASTPSPIASPLAPPTAARDEPTANTPPAETPPATLGALALDAYTQPSAPSGQVTADDGERPAPPDPALARPVATSAAAIRPVVLHDELDPDVRAIVDDLYAQARAELSGTELSCFVPAEHVEHVEQDGAPVPEPQPPADPPAAARTRGGWVPALTTDERDRRR